MKAGRKEILTADVMARAFLTGKCAKDVAEENGVSLAAVSQAGRKHGVKLRRVSARYRVSTQMKIAYEVFKGLQDGKEIDRPALEKQFGTSKQMVHQVIAGMKEAGIRFGGE